MTPDVTVVGSANLDLVLRVAEVPAAGETVLAHGREEHVGGKGLNQALAAARAGATVELVATLGRDVAADRLLRALADDGVGTRGVGRVDGTSGNALVTVSDAGENVIVVDPGANGATLALDEPQRELVRTASVVLCQLETPLELVQDTAAEARAAGVRLVLNAAPARPLPASLLRLVDVLVVNEHEACALTDEADPATAACRLAGSVADVVVTLGAGGALHVGPGGDVTHVPGVPAEPVDTTGAGDAFTGYLAAHLASGAAVVEGLPRAVAAGSLAVRVRGAVPSLPTRRAVEELLARGG